MKSFILILVTLGFLIGCSSNRSTVLGDQDENLTQQDTVKIANEELEYEIIIIEPGFTYWLNSVARPEGYYSQSFLEGRNWIYVMEWNRRVLNPTQYGDLYLMQIDYDPNIDYGYEVNYMLYNYFIYFQRKYKQRLAGFVPRV